MKEIFTKESVDLLLSWFDSNGEKYPWGETPDPYSVWISEIMLQQTVIKAVIPFYLRWMSRYPDLQTLAASSETEVLRCWEGLGYYSRARNILKTSRIILKDYRGEFPDNYDTLISLPGIGNYTAGAVLSIAFGGQFFVYDANVKRIVQRLTENSSWDSNDEKDMDLLLKKIVPAGSAGSWNCALMQLGQLVCRNRRPECSFCPFNSLCLCFQNGTQNAIPEVKKREIIEKKTEIVLAVCGDRILLEKRKTGIGTGLWFFPRKADIDMTAGEKSGDYIGREIHTYTNFREWLYPVLVSIDENEQFEAGEGREWVLLSELEKYPMPAVYRKLSGKLYRR